MLFISRRGPKWAIVKVNAFYKTTDGDMVFDQAQLLGLLLGKCCGTMGTVAEVPLFLNLTSTYSEKGFNSASKPITNLIVDIMSISWCFVPTNQRVISCWFHPKN